MCAIIAPYFDEAILIQGISHILMRNYFVFALGYAKAKKKRGLSPRSLLKEGQWRHYLP